MKSAELLLLRIRYGRISHNWRYSKAPAPNNTSAIDDSLTVPLSDGPCPLARPIIAFDHPNAVREEALK